MSNQELIAQSENPMTIDEVKNQVVRIQSVMRAVMKDGEHYGTIPGTDKKTLYKAGAEKLISTFRLVPDPEVKDLCMGGEIHYRVKVKMFALSGVFIGAGIGECSSGEEKYSWRKAVCPEEFNATAEDRKRVKWKAGYKTKSAFSVNQVRMNPADIANTILKMAKKRALIDAVLTILAASDIFTQDIEDYPPEVREAVTEEKGHGKQPPPLQQPKRKSEAGKSDPKNGTKKEGVKEKSPYYEFLDRMKKAKGGIGDKKYYEILGAHGFEHANESTTKKQQDAIYQDMLAVAKAKSEMREPGDES